MKRFKNLKKIAYICIIQIVILLFFAWAYYCSAPAKLDNIKNTTIIVEDLYYYSRGSKTTPKLFVSSDSSEYVFFNTDNYSALELSQTIKIGDKIELAYTERFGLFGQYNMVCAAYSETQTYSSLDYYINTQRNALRISIVVFIFIEIIFIFLSIASIILFWERKKIKKKSKHSTHKEDGVLVFLGSPNPNTSKKKRKRQKNQLVKKRKAKASSDTNIIK